MSQCDGGPGGAGIDDIRRRVMELNSDERKCFRRDPGRPECCEVYRTHRERNLSQAEAIADACRSGLLGCSDCRERLIRVWQTQNERTND